MVVCSLDLRKSISDQGHTVSEHMKQAEGIPVVQWDLIFDRMGEMLPLFDKVQSNLEFTEGEEMSLPAMRSRKRSASSSPEKGFDWNTPPPCPIDDNPVAKKPRSKKVGDMNRTRKPKPAAADAEDDGERHSKPQKPADATDLSRRLGGGGGLRRPPSK